MSAIAALVLTLIFGPPVPRVPHQPYTCITDYECQAACEGRGDTHCDDMMYKEDN